MEKKFLFIVVSHASRRSLHDSFDHLIRSRQHVRRNGQGNLLGGFQVDDKFELLRLFDPQISGLCAFQNLVHVRAEAPRIVLGLID